MITIENADKALKDYYLDAVSAQLNDNISPFFSAIEKSTNYVFGKDVKMSVVRGAGGNIVAGAEDGDLPDPYKNRYLSITMPLKNLYGTIEISDKALRASRDSSGAFVNLVNSEMEGLISSAKLNFQRMLFGDGSGKICKILSSEGDDDTTFKVDSAKSYFVGMQVDVYLSSAGAVSDAQGVFIVAVDVAKSTITFNREISAPLLNATVYLHGSKDNELCGLGAIFDADTLYGYKKSEENYFAPYKVKASGTLTEDMLTDVLDYLEEHCGSKADMIICSYKTRKKIAALIAENRRVVNTVDAHTGFGTVAVNDVPVYADRFCPEGKIMFLNSADFCLNQLCDWEWLEDENGKILKQIPGKAAYSATLVKYAELICKRPCGQAMIYDV